MTATRHDIVIFGATSFVGQILCRYLLEQFGTTGKPAWALAGRSAAKLEQLRSALGPAAARLPILLADAADTNSLQALCAQARVVVSTVGPYALYGEPLVQVCAQTGTDYADLTGEAHWIRRMIERHEADARRSGARIVHCCGFDSIPSDLGVHVLQKEAVRRFGKPFSQVKMRVKAMRGGASGGTVASIVNIATEAVVNPALRKELADPYSLCPPGTTRTLRQPNVTGAEFDADFRAWVAPFVMSAINTRIVLRTNALSGNAYGNEFRYDEAVLTGAGIKGRLAATAISAGLKGFMIAIALPPTRWALNRFVLPEPGEGPSPQAQQHGFFDLRFIGCGENANRLRVKVTGDRDPGYGSTGKMLGQAAACLALDVSKTERPGGFWTPATILGDRLVARLQAHAGLNFEISAA